MLDEHSCCLAPSPFGGGGAGGAGGAALSRQTFAITGRQC